MLDHRKILFESEKKTFIIYFFTRMSQLLEVKGYPRVFPRLYCCTGPSTDLRTINAADRYIEYLTVVHG